eukprot:1993248-Pyramimonas_sp.AAC.1
MVRTALLGEGFGERQQFFTQIFPRGGGALQSMLRFIDFPRLHCVDCAQGGLHMLTAGGLRADIS